MALIEDYFKIKGKAIIGAEADLVNNETDARVDSCITDEYGKYRFENVSSGNYRIEFYGRGAKPEHWIEEIIVPTDPGTPPKYVLSCDFIPDCQDGQNDPPGTNPGYLSYRGDPWVQYETTIYNISGFWWGGASHGYMPTTPEIGPTYYIYWDPDDPNYLHYYKGSPSDPGEAVTGKRRLIGQFIYNGTKINLSLSLTFGAIFDGDHLVTGTIDCSLVKVSTDPEGIGARVEIDGEGLKSYSDATTIKALVGKLNSDWGLWGNIGGFGGSNYANRYITIDSDGLRTENSSARLGKLDASHWGLWGKSGGFGGDGYASRIVGIDPDGIFVHDAGQTKRLIVGKIDTSYGIQGLDTDGITELFGIYGTTAKIAGWNFDESDLWHIIDGYGIQMEGDNSLIQVGEIDGINRIIIEGVSESAVSIRSGNFNPGPTGAAGFKLDGILGSIEIIDGTFWGKLKAVMFEAGEVNVVNGDLVLTDASKLTEDLDASETGVDVEDGSVFSVDDLLMVGTSSEVMEVDSIDGNTLTVIRGARTGHGATTHNKQEVIYKVGIANGTHDWLELLSSTGPMINVKHSSDDGSNITFSSYVTLHKDAYLLLGTGNDIARIDAGNATYRLWVGNAVAADAPFRVGKNGALTATSAMITGDITANTGYIGGVDGWTIAAKMLTGAADSKIISGILESSDWGASAGSQLDLVNKTLIFGGSDDWKLKIIADGTLYADEIRSNGNIYLDEDASQYESHLYFHGTDGYLRFQHSGLPPYYDYFQLNAPLQIEETLYFGGTAYSLWYKSVDNKFILSHKLDLGSNDLLTSGKVDGIDVSKSVMSKTFYIETPTTEDTYAKWTPKEDITVIRMSVYTVTPVSAADPNVLTFRLTDGTTNYNVNFNTASSDFEETTADQNYAEGTALELKTVKINNPTGGDKAAITIQYKPN